MASSSLLTAAPLTPSVDDVAGLIAEQAMRQGQRAYLESARDDRSLTFAALERSTDRWVRHLARHDVEPGAAVVLSLSDPMSFANAFMGLLSAGRWVVPLDPAALALDPDGTLRAAHGRGAVTLIADPGTPEDSALALLPLPTPETTDVAMPSRLMAGGCAPPEGGVILSSSGTTGPPKVVRLDQSRLLYVARLVATHHGLSSMDRGFNPLPLFHVNAEVVGLLASLVTGSTLILDARFQRTGFWETVARSKATWINAVPAIVTLLADLREGEEVPSGIRFVRSASAPLPAETMTTFERVTGIPVVESYGMTEAASQIAVNPLEARRAGSVGLPQGVDVRIETAQPGGVGPVQIKGPSVITEYEGDGHTDRFTDDGWLRTGDIGQLDDDGYLFLLAREDDVINRSGEKIFPREIEDVLLADPAVVAAAVVPREDRVLGQVPVAFVVVDDPVSLRDAASADRLDERLRDRLTASLVHSRRPSEVRVVSALPAGPTGKVKRRAVRDLLSSPALLLVEGIDRR